MSGPIMIKDIYKKQLTALIKATILIVCILLTIGVRYIEKPPTNRNLSKKSSKTDMKEIYYDTLSGNSSNCEDTLLSMNEMFIKERINRCSF
ncbi:MAG: hypothetical protein D6B27_10865 [Gammaproteobacteria bacterium]|nr:MAG: hypothetical protein D6B27_10865 [Gammaproteobacteria bacterium]